MRGFVYILANENIQSLLKIGYSERDPELRAGEISATTGVPGKYEVLYCAFLDGPQEVEKYVHSRLSAFRIDKEFFEVSLMEAVTAVRSSSSTIVFESLSSRAQELCPELAIKPQSWLVSEVQRLERELKRVAIEMERYKDKAGSKTPKQPWQKRSGKKKRGY